MSTITTDNEGFKAMRFPDNVEDYTVEDHMIVAADKASDTVEQYWHNMHARPSLLDFGVMVAKHYSDVKLDEAGHESPF